MSKKGFLLVMLHLFGFLHFANSQNTVIDSTLTEVKYTISDSTIIEAKSQFKEIKFYPIIKFPFTNDSAYTFTKTPIRYEIRSTKSDLTFYIFIIFVFLVVIVLRMNFLYFVNLFKSALNFRISKQQFRDEGQTESQINLLLTLVFIISYGFLINNISNPRLFESLFYSDLLNAVFLVSVFYIFKLVLYYGLGFLLKIEKELKFYLFNTSIFIKIAGLVLLPLLFFIQYSTFNNTISLALFWLLTLFIVIKTLQRGYIISSESTFGTFFHFLLYFCGLELIPFLVFIKIIFNVSGTNPA